MKKRLIKNARHSLSTISQNDLYNFSLKHTISLYPLDIVFTFIPKNACSSLRYSAAIANEFLSDASDINWIHENNETFMPTQRETICAKYTFVVLRCPFKRIASCFFDKIVDGLFNFKDASGDKFNVSFNDFLSVIKSQNRRDRDVHWRNQSDFLHYEKYDDYFSLESFVKAIQSLDKRGFIVHDTRSVLNHDASSMNRVEGDFSKMKEIEIKKMKEEGILPSYKSMFTQSEIELVNDIYKDDIDLYKTQFGEKNLLF
jgi:hypothetical protein